MYAIINRYYKLGIYNKENVAVFVVSGDITPADYKKITGEEYPA